MIRISRCIAPVSTLMILSAMLWANTPHDWLEVNLELQFDTPFVTNVTATQERPSQAPGLEGQGLLIIGRDDQGDIVFKQWTADPSLVRAEIFDPESGTHQFSETVENPNGRFTVFIPNHRGIHELEVYRPIPGGKTQALLGRAPLKAPALKKEQPATRGAYTIDGTTTIIDNGDSANRVDLVIIGDGYTAAEMSKYASDVAAVASGFLGIEPYAGYDGFFNVHRIDVVSNESGVDHPESSIYKDTALDSTYNCSGIQRLICSDTGTAQTIAQSQLTANQRDIIMIVVNDATYGGSGGSIAVISTHASAVDLALHEIGHSFGLLADEYTDNPELCNPSEPSEPNSTTITNRNTTKWAHWIDAATPIPTPTGYGNTPGLYTGSRYCVSGMYRPTNNSMMRSLGQPFDAINEEALIKRFYAFADPIDSRSPTTGTVNLSGSQSQTFTVNTVAPSPNTTEVSWYLNNVFQSSGASINLSAGSLSNGTYTLRADVSDNTTKVMVDPSNLLEDSTSWTVIIGGGGGSAPATPTGLASSNIGSTSFTAQWNASSGAASYDLQLWQGGAWTDSGSTASTSYNFSGLPSNSTQYVRVRAVNTYGSSSYSGWIQVDLTSGCSGPPATPSGLNSSGVGSTSFTATWNGVSGADSYSLQLWVNGAWTNSGSSSTTSHTFTGLASGSTQYVRVAGVNTCGVGTYSAWITVNLSSGCTSAPGTPTGFTSSVQSASSFTLSWNAVSGATSYDLQRWTGTAWVDYTSTSNTSQVVNLSGTQYFRVRATNSCGSSAYSAWIQIR